MNPQQGVISLVDIFKSFSRTGTGTAYTVPTADSGATPPTSPTTALVRSIRLSNQTGSGVATTVTVMDYSNSSLEIEFYKIRLLSKLKYRDNFMVKTKDSKFSLFNLI